jgi:hypothetical protein
MTLLTSKDCYALFGEPEKEKNMTVWTLPASVKIDVLPKKIYCNKLLVEPLTKALQALKANGIEDELRTFDGCFNIRKKRGATTASLHSWGMAIDVNAAWNGFGKKPTLSEAFVRCFDNAGFDWGGKWGKPDGMHFQLKKELAKLTTA